MIFRNLVFFLRQSQYTEFTSYAALLAGAAPQTLQASLIAQHRQTWKLREHHLLADVPFADTSSWSTDSDSADAADGQGRGEGLHPTPLPEGEALRAHLPPSDLLAVTETPEGVALSLPSSYMSPLVEASARAGDRHLGASSSSSSAFTTYTYKRYRPEDQRHKGGKKEGGVAYAARVRDIILTGEGHSSWGEFKLMGRIRRFDGFIHLVKEYVRVSSSLSASLPSSRILGIIVTRGSPLYLAPYGVLHSSHLYTRAFGSIRVSD